MSDAKRALRVFCFTLFAASLVVVGLPAQAAPDPLDTTFQDPNLGGDVSALAIQSDGKILAGGSFSTAGVGSATYNKLARFNTNGSLDTSFMDPGLNGTVFAIAVQSDGKILVGGAFNQAWSTTYIGAVRLNSDGTLDTGFSNPNFDGNIYAIHINGDGSILFGGDFSSAGLGGFAYDRLARFNANGTVDTSFLGSNFNQTVYAIGTTSTGKILVGGNFTSTGAAPYGRMARLNADGTVDTGFSDPAFNNLVRTFAVQSDGKIVAGGNFTDVNGTPRARLARLTADGALDTTLANPQFGGTVAGIAIQGDGKIVAAGAFTTVGPSNTAYGRLVRLTSTGAIDTTFENPFLNNDSFVALQSDGRILAYGLFTTAGASNTTYRRLARFNAAFYSMSVTAPANGTVTSSVGGINCGATCSAQFTGGTSVTLTATPSSGYSFASWGGGCSGTTSPLTVTLSADTACTASFTASGAGSSGPVVPAIPPSFVAAPVPAVQNATTVGMGTGSVSLASSFVNAPSLVFRATQNDGAALPSWLTFDPSTVSFAYNVPIPTDLPVQPLADSAADGRANWANTVYPLVVRVAQVPVTLAAQGSGQSYVSTVQMNFYAPRSPVAISAVSLSLDGARGNARSGRSALSWDGGQMVFETASTNIFPTSANTLGDIVRYHAASGDRDRLSQTAIPGGGVANAADGASMSPAVSSDGGYAAFASDAPGITLAPNGGVRQIYRTALGYPRVALNAAVTPAPDMVSVTVAGVAGNGASDKPVLSHDGRYVAFESTATTFGGGVAGLRRIWRKDMQTGALEAVSSGAGLNPSISWDGRYVAFDDGTQVYLRDMTTSTARTIAAGTRPCLTARADRIAFVAGGQVMLAEVATGGLRVVTAGNAISDDPAISADGRFVAFRSAATNLVAGFAGNGLAQIFLQDVERGVTALVTQTAAGGPGNGASWSPALSGDGSTVAFASDARDLVNGNPTAGQAYLAANPLPLPDKTGYWYMASIGGGQGWVMERWGNKAYVGGLAYDGQGRSQWLAGLCTLSGLTCAGTLNHGPAFAVVTAETGNNVSLSIAGAAPQTLTMFPIGGSRTTGFAGLPQAGWWYEPGAGDNIGYFLDIDTQPQTDGSMMQVGYLTVLAYDATGRAVWQVSQAKLGADLSFSGQLTQYEGGAPFGVAAPAGPASGSVVGQVRMIFEGTERAQINLPNGRTAILGRFRF